MSNRKKSKIEKLFGKASIPAELELPEDEKVELKRIPADIKWADVKGVDREDVETIGEAVIFDDGTQDIIVFSDISEDAKKLMGGFRDLGMYSISDQN